MSRDESWPEPRVRIAFANSVMTWRRQRLFSRRLRFLCGRLHEFCIVHGNILFHFTYLNGEAATRPGERPTERDLHSVCVAVIRVIDLRGKQAESSVAITDQPHEQARLSVEIQMDRRLAVALAHHHESVVVADLLRALRLHLTKHCFQVRGEMQVS